MNSRYEFDGSHAAPMLLTGEKADPLLVARQEELGVRFEELAHLELDSLIGEEVASFVAYCIRQRMAEREGQNSHSFISRKNKLPRFVLPGYTPNTVLKAMRAAKNGTSTPLQSRLTRQAYGMGSIEIANLTTIGTARHEFRESMQDSIQKLAGHAIDFGVSSMYKPKYLGSDTGTQISQRPRAIRVGYQSLYSEVNETTKLKGRSAAVIDVRDHELYPSDVLQYLQETNRKNDETHPVHEIPEFQQIVRTLLSGIIAPAEILARNETAY